MKIRVLIGPLMAEIATIIVVLLITFVPSEFLHIVIGLPLLLFLPGYSLLSLLFAGRKRPGKLEWVVLSFGMSVAIATLLGLGLNYTPWGITLNSVLYCVGGFTVLMTTIAWVVRLRLQGTLMSQLDVNLPGWGGSALSKSLSILVVASLATTVAILLYTAIRPNVGERFTEFYVLGLNGKAEDYPTTFLIRGSQVTSVIYGRGTAGVTGLSGAVTVGIVNEERRSEICSLKVTIDGEPADIGVDGATTSILGGIELRDGEKWEHQVVIVPRHVGENQRVEFQLFKGIESTPQQSLHLWINVRPAN